MKPDNAPNAAPPPTPDGPPLAAGTVIFKPDTTADGPAADDLSADPTSLARFLAEAKAAGKLNHPNVVAIYEISQEGPTHYLVLEYVSGGSLADRLAGEKPMPVLE